VKPGQETAHLGGKGVELAVFVEHRFIANCGVSGALTLAWLLDHVAWTMPTDDLQVLVSSTRIDHLEIALDYRRDAHQIPFDKVRYDGVDCEVPTRHLRQNAE
jgi:hypothetical protein